MPDLLSVDAAVAMLDAAPEAPPPEETAAAPVKAVAEVAPEPVAEEAAPEGEENLAEPTADTEAGAEEPTGEGEAEPLEPAQPAIEPPRSWDNDARTHWDKMPRELQQVVLEREADRDRAVSTAVQEASEARKSTQATNAQVEKLSSQLTDFLPQALKTFEDRWGETPDWESVLAQYGSDETLRLQMRYETERKQIGELARKESEARTLVHQNFVIQETTKLAEISPDLSHPETGGKLRQDVASYAMQLGAVSAAELPNVSAAQLTMAHKAMLYDRLPDAVKAGKLPSPLDLANPAPKPVAAKPPAKPAVRPSAAPAPASQTRTTQQAATRFSQSRTLDDAVALLDSRRR